MDYDFVNNLNDEQLEFLKNVLTDHNLGNSFLKTIDRTIFARADMKETLNLFEVEAIPYYDENLEDKCLSVLSRLCIGNFYFFTRSFYEFGNNGKRFWELDSETNEALDILEECFGVEHRRISAAFQYPDMYGFDMYLSAFENFFAEESMRGKYNNSFNIYNYIKSYIYQCLRKNPTGTDIGVFNCYGHKQLIVERDLRKIASYLISVRGDDKRCSIANAGLSKTAQKVSGELTFHQQRLVEAIAFGTTLEKLNAGNYEDSKKLIYLP